jgi:2,4-dienoyl-CoA reductase-like NADH-dependent reductase (Old Yellow Enzyme family)
MGDGPLKGVDRSHRDAHDPLQAGQPQMTGDEAGLGCREDPDREAGECCSRLALAVGRRGRNPVAEGIHSVGAPAIVQISHAGGVANKKVIHNQPAGPSSAGKTRKLETCELHAITEQFSAAAERAVKAGFDGVELHGAHGYLLNQFFSPLLNKRDDEYGGSLEKRMRFPLEVTKAVRQSIGTGKLLLYRLGSDDLAPHGTHIENAIVFAQKLVDAGVDILDVSGGMCGSNPKQFKQIKGYFVPQAQMVKQTVDVPVDWGGAWILNPSMLIVLCGKARWIWLR